MGARLKIEAHDASRIEWSVYVPLPLSGGGDGEAEVELTLEIPENVYAPHECWEQLQILARLSSPDEDAQLADAPSMDELRKATLGVARKLKLLREELPRARVLHALNPLPVAPRLLRDLGDIIDRAVLALSAARERLTAPSPQDPPELLRERELADEFLSGQLLELLTSAEETSGKLPTRAAGTLPGYRAVALKLRRRIGGALGDEMQERARRGYVQPEEGDLEGLSAFLDRAAMLKKHFQEVLFLEPEVTMVDQRVRNYVGLVGAAFAFLGAFALQTLQTGAAARAGLSVGTVLTLGAVAYGLKDRMKELTKQWLSGKLSRLYANRVLTLRAPARILRQRPVVLQARESITQTREGRPDPLNPAAGGMQRLVVVRYQQRTRVRAQTATLLAGFERVKMIFRYDLGPLLTRLDDSIKRVPVPAFGRTRVRFADAPRVYRVALCLRVRTEAGEEQRRALVLLQRQGIGGITPLPDAAPDAKVEVAPEEEAPVPGLPELAGQ